jgi:serine protease
MPKAVISTTLRAGRSADGRCTQNSTREDTTMMFGRLFCSLLLAGLLSVLGILTACGGSGGGDSSPPPTGGTPNTAPVANAGAAQSVAAGSLVTLNGAGSSDANGDALTYSWTLVSRPAGSTAALIGPTTARPTFTADVAGAYTLSLVVNDGKVGSAAVTVAVTAAAAANVAPVANLGADRTAVTGVVVQMDGRASSDANGDPLTYVWALVKPAGSAAVLLNSTTSTPSFTPDVVGLYGVGLIVSDGRLNSPAKTVIITATAAAVGPFSITGTVLAPSVSTVDSDTNDTNQRSRASNNTFATAQLSGNPGLVVGYVNEPLTGPRGANYTAGDTKDIYRADLVAGQVVELSFGDDQSADLDINVYDSTGRLVGSSEGVSRSECVLVRRTGTYYIEVLAFDGASTYELSWAAPRPSSTCRNVTPASADLAPFVAGDVIARAATAAAAAVATGAAGATGATVATAEASNRADAWVRSAGLAVRTAAAGDGPRLFSLPTQVDARAQAMRVLQRGDRVRALSATSATTEPNRQAPSDAPEETKLAVDTVVAAKLMRRSGQFAYAELNQMMEASQVRLGTWPPNDTDVSRQPHLDLIKLPQAFAALSSQSPVSTYIPIVAVVDTGVVASHPELSRMLVPGYDFVSNTTSGGDGDGIDADPNDASGAGQNASFHGTHVAGTVAAETFNGAGMVGVAPMARIMPVRVLGVTGSGSLYDIMQGMRFAARLANDSTTLPARRADVINLSLGGAGACSATMAETISAVRAQGSIVVIAAGNEKGAPVSSPANCPGAIAVSAIAYDGALATYSNVGAEVAVTAPGGDSSRSTPAGRDEIWSLSATFVADAQGNQVRRPSYRGLQGTSMATPHVAGVMALMRTANPNLTPANVDALLAQGALTDDVGAVGRDNQFGWGRINALKAVQAAGAAPAVTPSLQLSPASLDFGATLTDLSVTVTRLNGSTDTPKTFLSRSLNPGAVQLTAPVGGNPAAGPFKYNVRLDRALLAPSETVIRVEITTNNAVVLPFDVVIGARPVLSASQRGVGPVYVLVVDADNTDTVAGNVTAQSTSTSYAYTVTGVKLPRVVVAAGTDLDNDLYICGPAEPCSAYPTLGSPTVLNMSANRTGIDLPLTSGSTNGASLLNQGSGTATVKRGIKRAP